MTEDEDFTVVDHHLQALSEHFDSVQIFCTRHEMGSDGGTVSIARGQGNWWARRGQVREWAERMDESSRMQERKNDDV